MKTIFSALLLVLSLMSQSQNQQTNNNFQVEFNPENSTLSFHDSANQFGFEGLSAVIHTTKVSFSTSENGFVWEKTVLQQFIDSLGTGNSLIVGGYSRKIKMGVNFHLNVYDSLPGLTIEVSFTNRSSDDLNVYSVEPIHATGSESGIITTTNFTKALLNAAMYYDAGSIHTLGTPFIKGTPSGETKGGKMHENELSGNTETVESWWN